MTKTLPEVWYRNPWTEIDPRDCLFCGSMSHTRHFARCPFGGGFFDWPKMAQFDFNLENLRRRRSGKAPVRRLPEALRVVVQTRVRPLRSHSVTKLSERIGNRT
jgi:hypothetical protein